MTAKDYKPIAEAFARAYVRAEQHGDCPHGNIDPVNVAWLLGMLREDIAKALAKDNPRFDVARFKAACEDTDL